MKVIECTGKDIEQALQSGLKELDCKLDDVEVKILAHPGIFSKARVQLTLVSEKAGGPAVSEIMRNLERRAKEANDDRRPREKNNAEKRDNSDRRDDKPRRDEQKQVQQQPVREQNDKRKQELVRRQTTVPAPVQSAPPALTTEQAKEVRKTNGFRTDFRAELKAAANGTDARSENRESKQPEYKSEHQVRQENSKVKEERKPEAAKDKQVREVPQDKVDSVGEYLRKAVSLMGVQSDISVKAEDGEIYAELKTEDALVIGRRGETLDALEYLATLTTAEGDKYIHVNLDCGEYRARRNEAIRAEAFAAADKAVATGKRAELEPMNSASRREVHAALGSREDVITRSEGREPNRYVVVIPRTGGNGGKQQQGGKRNNNRRRHRGSSNRHSSGNAQ